MASRTIEILWMLLTKRCSGCGFFSSSKVLKETLRMCPPGSGTARITTEDTVIYGTKIPAHTTLGVSHFILIVFAIDHEFF